MNALDVSQSVENIFLDVAAFIAVEKSDFQNSCVMIPLQNSFSDNKFRKLHTLGKKLKWVMAVSDDGTQLDVFKSYAHYQRFLQDVAEALELSGAFHINGMGSFNNDSNR